MELTKKQVIWGILLFGTLIGLNETIIGSLHVQFKSVILSAITLSLLSVARYKIPKIGSSLLIIAIAILFKLTDLGVYFCKPVMVVMLGIGFEISALLLINKNKFKLQEFIFTNILTSIVTFVVFAIFETYIVRNEYWIPEKFNDYVFVKAPLTAITSALLTFIALTMTKKFDFQLTGTLIKKPVLSQLILGFSIAAIWLTGYFTMQ
jgi:hypothetical protein